MARKVSIAGAARKAEADQRKIARARETLDKARAKLAAVTSDSFENFVANVGLNTNNAANGANYGYNPITNERSLLEWMYRGSWICGKAVDCVADDMTRAGIELGSVLAPADGEKVQNLLQMTASWTHLNSAIKWSRLYGGAIAAILVDGQKVDTPLDVRKVGPGQFKGLQVFDRWMVNPSLNDLVTEIGPEVGLPRFYDVTATAPSFPGMRIHHSRCFRLEGVEMPFWQKLNLNMWGTSIFEPLYDRLVAFDSTTQGVAQLVYKAYLRTMKIKNLRGIVAAGNEAYLGLIRQMQMTRQFQVNEGITMIDSEDEFEAHQYAFSGLADVLLQFGQQLSGATGIPLVRLFGQSPAGLNSTGESDLRNYYDTVAQQQELRLRLPLNTMLLVAMRSEGIEIPEGFTWMFRPCWQLTAKEKAEVAEIKTRTVLSASSDGAVSVATVLKELRTSAIETGVWTNISDEEIAEAEANPLSTGEMNSLQAQQVAEAGKPEPGEDDPGKPIPFGGAKKKEAA